MKRHTTEEILSKLKQAEQLSASGLNQAEICKALNVSIMTFYRWKKSKEHILASRGSAPVSKILPAAKVNSVKTLDETTFDALTAAPTLRELADENRRLRKIVTDLLLEKLKLEESSLSQTSRSLKQKSGEPAHGELITTSRQK